MIKVCYIDKKCMARSILPTIDRHSCLAWFEEKSIKTHYEQNLAYIHSHEMTLQRQRNLPLVSIHQLWPTLITVERYWLSNLLQQQQQPTAAAAATYCSSSSKSIRFKHFYEEMKIETNLSIICNFRWRLFCCF